MKHSITLTLLLLLCAVAFSAKAQDRWNEIGFRTSNFKNYGFIYKLQKNENTYHRFRMSSLSSDLNFSSDSYAANIRLSYGQENRVRLNKRLYFTHGFEPFVRLSSSSQESIIGSLSSFDGQLGLGYIIGAQYLFFKRIFFNVEIIPFASYRYTKSTNQAALHRFSTRFDQSDLRFTISYRFKKYKPNKNTVSPANVDLLQ